MLDTIHYFTQTYLTFYLDYLIPIIGQHYSIDCLVKGMKCCVVEMSSTPCTEVILALEFFWQKLYIKQMSLTSKCCL